MVPDKRTSYRLFGRLESSYAGSLTGVYGHRKEAEAYLTAERESWDERALHS